MLGPFSEHVTHGHTDRQTNPTDRFTYYAGIITVIGILNTGTFSGHVIS